MEGLTVLGSKYNHCAATLRRSVREYELDGLPTVPERELKGRTALLYVNLRVVEKHTCIHKVRTIPLIH